MTVAHDLSLLSPPGRRDATVIPFPRARLRVVPAPVGESVEPSAERVPVRLTARGRLVVGILGVLLAVAVVALVAKPLSGLREPGTSIPASAPAAVVVQPGDTLWEIAGRVAPNKDARVVVAELRRINALPSGDVHAGQQLRLRAP